MKDEFMPFLRLSQTAKDALGNFITSLSQQNFIKSEKLVATNVKNVLVVLQYCVRRKLKFIPEKDMYTSLPNGVDMNTANTIYGNFQHYIIAKI